MKNDLLSFWWYDQLFPTKFLWARKLMNFLQFYPPDWNYYTIHFFICQCRIKSLEGELARYKTSKIPSKASYATQMLIFVQFYICPLFELLDLRGYLPELFTESNLNFCVTSANIIIRWDHLLYVNQFGSFFWADNLSQIVMWKDMWDSLKSSHI